MRAGVSARLGPFYVAAGRTLAVPVAAALWLLVIAAWVLLACVWLAALPLRVLWWLLAG